MTQISTGNGDLPIVCLTGMGIVTSLGIGKDDNWRALTASRSGIHAITRFATAGFNTRVAGTVDFLNGPPESGPDLSYQLSSIATEEALAQAGLPSDDFPGPLYMAVPPAEFEWPHRLELYEKGDPAEPTCHGRLLSAARQHHDVGLYDLFTFGYVAEQTAEKFGTKGAPITLSTACASGATAIQLGVEAIRRGDCQAALCIGTDGSVQPESLARFALLSALSTQNDPPEQAAKPFSKDRDGFVMAEGAGAVVLENLEHARARGAEIQAIMRGIGERADDFHRTRSRPDGSAIIGAIRNVLDDAQLEPDQVDYVNAHGTGTPENDKMEYLALNQVFGNALGNIPVSSNKSMIGHTLTAAGAVEAIFSVLTIQNGRIPPTINCRHPDPAIPLDVVADGARDAPVGTVMSNSFGFGGQNVCLIITAP